MLTARQARRVAESWVREEAERVPGFAGALLAGSSLRREPDDPHPPGSDVDVWVVIDGPVPDPFLAPAHPLALHKSVVHGVVLDRMFLPWKRLEDPAAVLSDMFLAPVLAAGAILSDPSGRLSHLGAAVAAEHRRRAWVRSRLDGVRERVLALCHAIEEQPPLPVYDLRCWRIASLLMASTTAAAVPAVAALRDVTIRRGLVVAREILAGAGRMDLADSLLQTLGSAALGRAEVERLVAETERAYDAAVAVHRKRFALDCYVGRDLREYALGGIRELLGRHHREAMYFAAFVRAGAQNILENDGAGAERTRFREGFLGMLAALGIEGERPWAARAAAIQQLLPRLRDAADVILERNPVAQE